MKGLKNCIAALGLLALFVLTAPAQISIVPNTASPASGSGAELTFTVQFQSSVTNNTWYAIYIGPNFTYQTAANACQIAAFEGGTPQSPTTKWDLANDAGTAVMYPDSSGTISNSHCMLIVSGSSIVVRGNIVTATFHVYFSEAWANRPEYILAYGDISGSGCGPYASYGCTGWNKVANWTPTAPSSTQLNIQPTPPPGPFPQVNWSQNAVPAVLVGDPESPPSFVPPGGKGTIRVCYTENGKPVAGVSITSFRIGGANPGSGWHAPHDQTGIRPSITFSTDGTDVDRWSGVSDATGCIYPPATIPNFAGEYWLESVTSAGGGTYVSLELVASDPNSEFYTFPFKGPNGIHDLSLSADSGHAEIVGGVAIPFVFSSTLQFQTQLMILGLHYYEAGWPSTTLNPNLLSIGRMSLPWGGWLDDDGPSSVYWSNGNTDPHSSGKQADIINPYVSGYPAPFLGNALQSAVVQANCSLSVANWEGGSNPGTIYTAKVLHIGGCQ